MKKRTQQIRLTRKVLIICTFLLGIGLLGFSAKADLNVGASLAPNSSPASDPIIGPAPLSSPGVNMDRLYNPNSGEHFYTSSSYEANSLESAGWRLEGVGWVAPSQGAPVYRLYNPNAGDHFYTLSNYERQSLVAAGWRDEGIGWYSGGSVAVLRACNPNAATGAHNFTTSALEQSSLVSAGWRGEGTAWYALSAGWQTAPSAPSAPAKPAVPAPYYFSQLNPQWAGVKFNDSTVGPSGCVPTSLAMVLVGCYGYNIANTDPGYVAVRMDRLSSASFGATGKDLINTAQSYGRTVEETSSEARAKELLQQGYPLIIYINVGIGHSLVCYGLTADGKTNVYDPYGGQFYPQGSQATLDSIWGKLSADPGDWDAGCPVFAVK